MIDRFGVCDSFLTYICEYLWIIHPYACHSLFPLNRPFESSQLHEFEPESDQDFIDSDKVIGQCECAEKVHSLCNLKSSLLCNFLMLNGRDLLLINSNQSISCFIKVIFTELKVEIAMKNNEA